MEGHAAHIYCMAYSFLVFDFGGDEDAAQQARHRIEGWRQGFRLDKKLQLNLSARTWKQSRTRGEPPAKASKGVQRERLDQDQSQNRGTAEAEAAQILIQRRESA